MNLNWSSALPKLDEANSFEEKASHDLDKMAEAILTISIDIGNKRIEQLIVKETDNIQNVVEQFSILHSLDSSQKEQLITKIRENLEQTPDNDPPKIQYEKEILNTIKRMKEKKQKSPTTYKIPLIDSKSKEIVQSKGLCAVSVFERLTRPKNCKASRPQTTLENRKISISEAAVIGQRMYMISKEIKHKKDRLAKEIKKEKDAKECEELTFMPKVNRWHERQPTIPIKNLYLSQDDMYSFKPCTDRISHQIDKAINPSTARHEVLYKDAQERQIKSSMAQEPIFKFQPTITPFQSKNQKQAQEHIEIKATQNIEDKELTFHPKIGKPPTNLAEPVSERLYAYKDTYMDSLTQRQMGEYNKGCATKAVIPKSNILVENRRRKNYESIFRCLDTDKDGLIDPNDINIRSNSHIRIAR